MNCPHCKTSMTRAGRDGDPMLANRGMLIKGGQVTFVCPKCKGDVPAGAEFMKALRATTVLFFQPSTSSSS